LANVLTACFETLSNPEQQNHGGKNNVEATFIVLATRDMIGFREEEKNPTLFLIIDKFSYLSI